MLLCFLTKLVATVVAFLKDSAFSVFIKNDTLLHVSIFKITFIWTVFPKVSIFNRFELKHRPKTATFRSVFLRKRSGGNNSGVSLASLREHWNRSDKKALTNKPIIFAEKFYWCSVRIILGEIKFRPSSGCKHCITDLTKSCMARRNIGNPWLSIVT